MMVKLMIVQLKIISILKMIKNINKILLLIENQIIHIYSRVQYLKFKQMNKIVQEYLLVDKIIINYYLKKILIVLDNNLLQDKNFM